MEGDPRTVLRLGSGICILPGRRGEGGVFRMEGRVALSMEGCPGENPGTENTQLGLQPCAANLSDFPEGFFGFMS